MFKRFVDLFADIVAIEINLNAAGAVLQCCKTCFAHHALEHHAPSNRGGVFGLGKSSLLLLAVLRVQGLRAISWHEIIRKSHPLRAQRGKLGASFCDQVVFVGHGGGGFGHDGLSLQ